MSGDLWLCPFCGAVCFVSAHGFRYCLGCDLEWLPNEGGGWRMEHYCRCGSEAHSEPLPPIQMPVLQRERGYLG